MRFSIINHEHLLGLIGRLHSRFEKKRIDGGPIAIAEKSAIKGKQNHGCQ